MRQNAGQLTRSGCTDDGGNATAATDAGVLPNVVHCETHPSFALHAGPGHCGPAARPDESVTTNVAPP